MPRLDKGLRPRPYGKHQHRWRALSKRPWRAGHPIRGPESRRAGRRLGSVGRPIGLGPVPIGHASVRRKSLVRAARDPSRHGPLHVVGGPFLMRELRELGPKPVRHVRLPHRSLRFLSPRGILSDARRERREGQTRHGRRRPRSGARMHDDVHPLHAKRVHRSFWRAGLSFKSEISERHHPPPPPVPAGRQRVGRWRRRAARPPPASCARSDRRSDGPQRRSPVRTQAPQRSSTRRSLRGRCIQFAAVAIDAERTGKLIGRVQRPPASLDTAARHRPTAPSRQGCRADRDPIE